MASRRQFVPLLFVFAAACGSPAQNTRTPPPPVAPLPGGAISGQSVPVWPVVSIQVDTSLHWQEMIGNRRQAMDKADSILFQILREVRNMVVWVPPAEVRRAAEKAPGILVSPDQMATGLLLTHAMARVPDQLAIQLRQVTAVATGGRYAAIPTRIAFVRGPSGYGRAELSLALVDVRLGAVSWSATGKGLGQDPWDALTRAVRELTASVGM